MFLRLMAPEGLDQSLIRSLIASSEMRSLEAFTMKTLAFGSRNAMQPFLILFLSLFRILESLGVRSGTRAAVLKALRSARSLPSSVRPPLLRLLLSFFYAPPLRVQGV